MANRTEIFVQGFDWGKEANIPDDASFLNPDIEAEEITARVDLNPLRIGRGYKIKFEIDEADDVTNEFFFLASETSFKFTDRLKIAGQRLKDFFKISEDTSYIKYAVDIKVNGNLIYKGIINQESLEESFNTGDTNKEITARITGYEVEFREYFRNKSLIGATEINWTGEVRDVNNVFKARYTSFPNFLRQLYPNVDFLLEDSIQNYLITDAQMFFHNDTNGLWFIKSGYDRVVGQGEENRYDFLRKLCCERGWILYFAVVDNELKLIIANRSNAPQTEKEINVNKLTSNGFKIKKKKPTVQYDYLIIIDGSMRDTGGGVLHGFLNNPAFTGERLLILTNKGKELLIGNHFSSVKSYSTRYQLLFASDYEFGKYWNEDDEYYRYRFFKYPADPGKEVAIPKNKTLRIPHGANTREVAVMNVNDKTNILWSVGTPTRTPTNGDILYYGTYGSMLFKSNGTTCETYQDDIRKPQFKNNYAKFLKNKNNQLLDLEVHEAIFHPYYLIKISGTTEVSNTDRYSVLSLEVDPEAGINGVTNLSLQKYVS